MPTVGEHVSDVLTRRRLDGKRRKMIQDLCDFCLQPHYIPRAQISSRKRGIKFGCSACHAQGKFKWKAEGGDGRILLALKTFCLY